MRFDLLLDEYTSVYYPFSQAPRRPLRNDSEGHDREGAARRASRSSGKPLFIAFWMVVVLAGVSAGAGFIGL